MDFPQKAVVLAAGYGTRLLPITKTVPKEMLPVINKPLIQYIVEQLVDSGIKTIIFITSPHKKTLEDYFDRNLELEHFLEKSGKTKELKEIKNLAEIAHFISIRQKEMKGTGHAILRTEPIIENEPFLVMWGDDLIESNPPIIKQFQFWFKKLNTTLIPALYRPEEEATNLYAYVKGKETKNYIEVEEIVEKPGPEKAKKLLPWAIFSPLLFTPEIFEELKKVKKPKNEEIFYVDGLRGLLKKGKKIYAIKIKNAKYYSCGNIVDYIKMILEFSMRNKKIKKEIKNFLKSEI
jgi:UTP--glucose-1-phosphate uridylyltransferase